jgi:hypothetical protein
LPNVTVSRSRGILIDPTYPNTVYVGTEGGGVFQSSDGGNHWTPINDGLTDQTVYAMAMDPEDPHTLYAGTLSDGVFVFQVDGEAAQLGGIASPAAMIYRCPLSSPSPESQALMVSLLPIGPEGNAPGHSLSRDNVYPMPDDPQHAGNVAVQSPRAGTTTESNQALPASVLRHKAHDQVFADLGGDTYNLRTCVLDADATIASLAGLWQEH